MPIETRQIRVYDTNLCSLDVNTTPDPQFVLSTLRCEQPPPRTVTTRIAAKRDQNPNSPSFGKWLTIFNSYTDDFEFAGYFTYDEDPISCPLPVAKTLRVDARLQVCNIRVTATRNDNPNTPLTVSFNIASIAGGVATVEQSGSVTIPSGQYTATFIAQLGVQANTLYIVQNMGVSDNAYPTPNASNVVGTPTSQVC